MRALQWLFIGSWQLGHGVGFFTTVTATSP